MKEYNLISKGAETSHDISETATLYGDIHQENDGDGSGPVDTHTIRSGFSKNKKTNDRKRKTKQASNDTDSDFEIPTYSKTNGLKAERNIRVRKRSYKYFIKEENLSNCEDDDVSDVKSERKSEEPIETHFSSNYLTIPTEKVRKVSDDSTIEGSNCGKRSHLKCKKEDSRTKRNPSAFSKPNPNFEYLVKASEIHNLLNTTHSEITTDKCEEEKISEASRQPNPCNINKENQSLLKLAEFLNVDTNSLKTGDQVNTYFTLLKDCFNLNKLYC